MQSGPEGSAVTTTGGSPPALLNGRVAIVTGAAQGIGKAVADSCVKDGAAVALAADIQAAKVPAVTDRWARKGAAVMGLTVDVTKPHSVQEMVEKTPETDESRSKAGRNVNGYVYNSSNGAPHMQLL